MRWSSLERGGDDAELIAHHLLDLPNSLLSHFQEMALEAVTKVMLGSPAKTIFETVGKTTSVVQVSRGLSATERKTMLCDAVAREKYRARSHIGIGFSVIPSDTSIQIADATLIRGEWTYDSDLEAHIASRRISLAQGQVAPRRNDPCYCGSGRKYKVCCLPRDRHDHHHS